MRPTTGYRMVMPIPRHPKRLRVVDGVTMHLRIPRGLHKKLLAMTRTEHRALNSLVIYSLMSLTSYSEK